MQHINILFSKINENILKQKDKKQAFILAVKKNIQNLEIEEKDFNIKQNKIRLLFFDTRRFVVLKHKDTILEYLKEQKVDIYDIV